jgi:hypothetical protein
MSDSGKLEGHYAAGLAGAAPSGLHPLPRDLAAIRSPDRRKAGGSGGSDRGIDNSLGQRDNGQGGKEVSFRERLMREINRAAMELMAAGVYVLLAIFALALVLFIAILAGAIK